jgi:predicted PurR-regulated permease PerM
VLAGNVKARGGGWPNLVPPDHFSGEPVQCLTQRFREDGLAQPESRRAGVPAAESPGLRELVGILVGAVVIAGLYFGRDVLIPIVSAILLAFVLAPLVQLLRRLRAPRTAAVLIAVSLSLSAIFGLGAVVGAQLTGLVNELPTYTATIISKVRAVGGLASGGLGRTAGRLGMQLNQVANDAASAPGSDSGTPASKRAAPLAVRIYQPPTSPLDLARQYLGPVLGPLATLALVFVVSVFILLQQTDLRDRLIRLFGASDLHRTTVAMDDAAVRLSRYFLTQLGVNTAFGAAIGIGVQIVGVPHALLWGVVAGLLRFVPFVGGVVSALLPAGLAAAVDPGWSMALWTLGLIWSAEAFTGQVVEPFLYGHSTGLSPVSVIVAAIFWAWLWGPIGLVLSTPVSLCLLVLGRHVPRLRFIEIMLGDRPPLTPVESFYQRLLAGDSDECLEQAELLIKEAPLSGYYDQVAMKGLQLAVHDKRRGVLDDGQIAGIDQSLQQVMADLEFLDDVEPPPGDDRQRAGPTPTAFELKRVAAPDSFDRHLLKPDDAAPLILCVTGRGVLDQLPNAMLAQLLKKHGLESRTVAMAELSRERIGNLDCSAVVGICVSSFQDSTGSSRLHYLVARLRERCPDLPIMLAVWGASDAEVADISPRAERPATSFNTLRDVVNACVEAARAGVESPQRRKGPGTRNKPAMLSKAASVP